MAYVLGIDIGTYESKGALTDETGRLLVSESVPHRLEMPQKGWAEHDAEQTWWHDFTYLSKAITRQAADQYGIRPKEIKAVGVSSIAPAVVPVDAQGQPLRKAILYGVDTRTQKQVAELNERLGAERIFQVSAQALSAQSAGPKILWIRLPGPQADGGADYRPLYSRLLRSALRYPQAELERGARRQRVRAGQIAASSLEP